jgi:outer membrane phospholipase A
MAGIARFKAPARVFAGLAVTCVALPCAHAGLSYTLDQVTAAPGATVRVQAVFFNDTTAGVRWRVPRELVLQWRDATGKTVRSLAPVQGDNLDFNIPVNNFARATWAAVVPAQAHGLQAVSIEGEPALMALDATAQPGRSIAAAPASVPVVDPRTGQPLSAAAVAAAGASPEVGPAPSAGSPGSSVGALAEPGQSAFDTFRNNLSEYEPIYFDYRPRGGATAKFQVSFKYRLFSPDRADKPGFADNLYLGYTQTSVWDLHSESVPFVDTTFNPSLFWLSDKVWRSGDQNWRLGMAGGVEHASNGKAGDDSRSVNDAFVQPALNYRFEGGSTMTFGPRIKKYFALADENRDYADYAGYVNWNLRWAQDNGLVASASYQQGASQHRTTQLTLAWPLKRTWLNMNGYLHLTYFNGYGDTLLGYNRRGESQIGIGLALVP